MTQTIYVMTEGDYSDYHIIGVYSTEELAKEAKEFAYPYACIEEYSLNQIPEHPHGLNYLNKNEVLTKNTKNIVIPEGFISRTEVAKLLGVSRQLIYCNIKKGKYITKEIDGKIFLSKESVINSKKKKKNSVSDT